MTTEEHLIISQAIRDLRAENQKLKALIKSTLEAWDTGFSNPSIRDIKLMREAIK